MRPPDYTVVIATMDRPKSLGVVLQCLETQTHRPARVVIADASKSGETRTLVATHEPSLPLAYLHCGIRSAARQRNHGAAGAETHLIAFMDDDIDFDSLLMETLCAPFGGEPTPNVAGVSGRETNMTHPRPRGLLRAYYRLQAGFDHPHYGGRLFGAAINCVPCYTEDPREMIPADWLPSTCVVYRREYFEREPFPDFEEYSAMEDVHTSARIARHGALFFAARAIFNHYSGTSSFKRAAFTLARHRMANRTRIAREVMALRGWPLAYRLFLHRVFLTAVLLRARPPQWTRELAGTWAKAHRG